MYATVPLHSVDLCTGATDINVDGFSDTVEHTGEETCNWEESIKVQAEWITEFEQGRVRIASRENGLLKASKIVNQAARDEALQLLNEQVFMCFSIFLSGVNHILNARIAQDMDVHIMLPAPCGWPVQVPTSSGRHIIVPGIPSFSTCMLVDPQGTFGGETSTASFRAAFGELPARVAMMLTQAMYKRDGETAYDLDKFLPASLYMGPYSRFMRFSSSANSMGVSTYLCLSRPWCSHPL